MPPRPEHPESGFSLVELSIVLVILGLLTGGILAGQSLIRASELRSVSTDFLRFNAAVNTFRDKYFALPGDMTNATKFWGVRAAGTDDVCATTINTYTGTCNGNGNGYFDSVTGDPTYGETFAAWQQLAYAGLIEGSYTGASALTTSSQRVVNVNLPPTKLGNSMALLSIKAASAPGNPTYFDATGRQGNIFGIKSTSDTAILKPEEQWNVDTKLDDGKPATGKLFAYKSTSGAMPMCATNDLDSAEYNVTGTTAVCYPLMYMF